MEDVKIFANCDEMARAIMNGLCEVPDTPRFRFLVKVLKKGTEPEAAEYIKRVIGFVYCEDETGCAELQEILAKKEDKELLQYLHMFCFGEELKMGETNKEQAIIKDAKVLTEYVKLYTSYDEMACGVVQKSSEIPDAFRIGFVVEILKLDTEPEVVEYMKKAISIVYGEKMLDAAEKILKIKRKGQEGTSGFEE